MLQSVEIVEDVWKVCLFHCLTTEKEEVMGLLLGDIEVRFFFFLFSNAVFFFSEFFYCFNECVQLDQNKRQISKISAVVVLPRIDKKKDRVEISPEQLALATTQAEELTKELKKPTRVIGEKKENINQTCPPHPRKIHPIVKTMTFHSKM